MRRLKFLLLSSLLSISPIVHASFIEVTMGTAVINDATATYYNPAALTLLKKSQFIALGSVASFHRNFTGESIQTISGFSQSGSTGGETHYYLPAIYLGIPTNNKITLGLAVVSNFFNNNSEEHSILRYAQSNNSVKNVDLVPAIGIKFNDCFSLGAGLNFSYADFLMQPTSGFPTLNIPDSESRNECNGTGLGADIGLLIKPNPLTMVGFNYQSAITYHLSGKSVLRGTPEVISDHYHFSFWTPARYVLTISRSLTRTLGVFTTIQRIQWSIFQNINVQGIATQVGAQPIIVDATVPYHLHDTWILTVGNNYRITPKWTIRFAGSYYQSPGNPNYLISNGDSIILGTSMGYEINKHLMIDGSYAHGFIQNQNIHIANNRNIISGVNTGSRDSVSVKLTLNA